MTYVAERNPAQAVVAGVERTLQLGRIWLSWDGSPRLSEDGDRIYTPHKAIRRYADHLIDHLAQIEALVAGSVGVSDGWRGSLVTFESDWARFTEVDLEEAAQRLRRLAQIYVLRLDGLGPESWDLPRDPEWSIREIIEHVAPPWYAEQVGDLLRD